MTDYVKQGKRNKRMGADFERRVRKDLEEKGWIVAKYSNNVDLEKNKCIPSKPGRFRMMQTGFPDFIAYTNKEEYECETLKTIGYGRKLYIIFFIECKVNGTLSKIEKEKAQWYLKNKYCSKFLIAYKTKEKNRVKVNYKEVELK